MERLTERWCKGMVRIKECSTAYPDKERKGAPMASAIARLATYDDAMPLERAQELAQAEKDERLIVLPYSLHQPLYILKNNEICRNYGYQWHFTDKESQTFGTLSMYGEFIGLDGFGKTVFLTRKEAEAALKKEEGKS